MTSSQAELPRSVRKGPPITVTCECGQKRDLQYGEQWRCEGCGRSYDTRKIPIEEYAAIRRTQLRYRIIPLTASLLLLAATIAFFIAGAAFTGLVLVAFVGASWVMFVRPFFRTKYRKSLGKNLPTWNLKADKPR
jgi:hypothetical protein